MAAAAAAAAGGQAQPVYQNICSFRSPDSATEKIHQFVQSKGLNIPNVEWGYVFREGKNTHETYFFIKTIKPLTKDEIGKIEQAIRSLGFFTYDGLLPPMQKK